MARNWSLNINEFGKMYIIKIFFKEIFRLTVFSDIILLIYRFSKVQLYFKRQEFLKSGTSVYCTQLFYEFRHSNPVILYYAKLNSSRLRAEQSVLITCFQYTYISVHKLAV